MVTFRISIVGIKGGVGKSTIASLLSKELALKGKKVLLIDRDNTGTISSLFGINGKGLLTRIANGDIKIEETYKKINVGKGLLTVFKLAGDHIESDQAINKISEDEKLARLFTDYYKQILTLENFDCVILDNHSLINYDSTIAKIERESFNEVFKDDIKYRVYVSEFPKEIVISTMGYLLGIEATRRYKGISDPFAFVINKVRNIEVEEAKSTLQDIISRINDEIKPFGKKMSLGVVMKFHTELYLDKLLYVNFDSGLGNKICSFPYSSVEIMEI